MNCWPNVKLILVLPFLVFASASPGQETRIVDFSADITDFDQNLGKNVFRLLGNVWMKHKDIVLTCDSAYLDQENNRFKGYSRVHIIKSDTLELFGDRLDYNGTTEMANLDGRVRMEHESSTLITEHLDYDMKNEISWYYDGGQIIDSLNILESEWGYYYADKEEYYFKNNVFMSNEDNTLSTDTLRYDSKNEMIYFLGPTQIFGDTNYIYCENGWYDSQRNQSSFNKNAVFQSGEQVLSGDSLFYDRDREISEGYGNVTARDTLEDSIIKGEKLLYDEGKKELMVTENTLFILAEDPDSLFLHADTLYSYNIDSLDSRKILAYHHVQFYRKDIQGRCDSLDYLVKDSLINLFGNPYLWQENSQLNAAKIIIKLGEDGIQNVKMINTGLMITEIDPNHYNQIKGKTVTGYFSDNKLTRVVVSGNSEGLFYPEDEKGMIGMNKAVSSDTEILFKEGKIDRVKFINEPDPTLYPLKDVKVSEMYLEGFSWKVKLRPLNKDDIYIWEKPENEPVVETIDN
jgi:lipopolysaccharide export system protein LptA